MNDPPTALVGFELNTHDHRLFQQPVMSEMLTYRSYGAHFRSQYCIYKHFAPTELTYFVLRRFNH